MDVITGHAYVTGLSASRLEMRAVLTETDGCFCGE
jgi:hypothetical protein